MLWLKAGLRHAGSWGVLPVRRRFARRSARLPPPFEHRRRDREQFAGEREARLAGTAGK